MKSVSFGSNSAAVMMGKEAGVVAKLKEQQPLLQAIHCFAHRLELGYKDAMMQIPEYKKLDKFLSNIYNFFHNSALNRSMLKILFFPNMSTIAKVYRVGPTATHCRL